MHYLYWSIARATGIGLALACLFECSCAGRNSDTLPSPDKPAAVPTIEHIDLEIGSVLSELQELSAPKGVEPSDWTEITDRLASLLIQRGLHRFPSTLPPADKVAISSLTFSGTTAEASLRWNYVLPADYDQNGEVNIADITPIGLHLRKTSASPDWEQARLADGDANAEVNLADITPLAVNFHNTVDGYFLQWSADSAAGPWTTLQNIPVAQGQSGGGNSIRHFLVTLTSANPGWYSVKPYSGADEGPVSNVVQLIGADPSPGSWSGPGGGAGNTNSTFAIGPQTAGGTSAYPLGDRIAKVQLGSDGNLYGMGLVSNLYSLDSTGQLRFSTSTDIKPTDFVLSPSDSACVAVPDGTLHIINSSGNVSEVVSLAYNIDSLEWHPDGYLLANCDDGSARGLDLDGNELWVLSEPGGEVDLHLCPSGKLALVRYKSGGVKEVAMLDSGRNVLWSNADYAADVVFIEGIGTNDDLYCYVNGDVVALNAADGSFRWIREIDGASGYDLSSFAVGPEGNVYFGTGGTAGFDGVTVWDQAGNGIGYLSNYSSDVDFGIYPGLNSRIWWDTGGIINSQIPGDGDSYWDTSGLMLDGVADASDNFYCSVQGQLRKYDSSGNLEWDFGLPPGNSSSLPAVAADGSLYFNYFGVIGMRPDYEVKWRVPLPNTDGQPSIGPDGTIYLSFFETESEPGVIHGGLARLDSDGNLLAPVDLAGCDYAGVPRFGLDGQFYLAWHDNTDSFNPTGYVGAFNADGTERWRSEYNSIDRDKLCLYSKEAQDLIYFHTKTSGGSPDDGTIHCLDGDGTFVYDYVSGSAQISSLLVGPDGMAYAITYNPSGVLALNTDGSLAWFSPLSNYSDSLALAANGQLRLIEYADPAQLVAYDGSGMYLWDYVFDSNANGSQIVDGNNTSYVLLNNRLAAVDAMGTEVFNVSLINPHGIVLGNHNEILMVTNGGELLRVHD